MQKTMQDIYDDIVANVKARYKNATPECSLPVLRRIDGKLQIAVFVYFHLPETAQTGCVNRPLEWLYADLESGTVLGAYNKRDIDDFTSEKYETMVNIHPDGYEPITAPFIFEACEKLNIIRADILNFNLFDTSKYLEYLNFVFTRTPQGLQRYYFMLGVRYPEQNIKIRVSTWLPYDMPAKITTREDAEAAIRYFDSLPSVYTVLSKSQADFKKRNSTPVFANMEQGTRGFICQTYEAAQKIARILRCTLSDDSCLIGRLNSHDPMKNLSQFLTIMDVFKITEVAFGVVDDNDVESVAHTVVCHPRFALNAIGQNANGQYSMLISEEQFKKEMDGGQGIQMIRYSILPDMYSYRPIAELNKEHNAKLDYAVNNLVSNNNLEADSSILGSIPLDTLVHLAKLSNSKGDRGQGPSIAPYNKDKVFYEIMAHTNAEDTTSSLISQKIRSADVLYFIDNDTLGFPLVSSSGCLYVFTNVDYAHVALRHISNQVNYSLFLSCAYASDIEPFFSRLFYRDGVKGIIVNPFIDGLGITNFQMFAPPDFSDVPFVNRPAMNPKLKIALLQLADQVQWMKVHGFNNDVYNELRANVLEELAESTLLLPMQAQNNEGKIVTENVFGQGNRIHFPYLTRKIQDGREIRVTPYFTDWPEFNKRYDQREWSGNLVKGYDLITDRDDAIVINSGSSYYFEVSVEEYRAFLSRRKATLNDAV